MVSREKKFSWTSCLSKFIIFNFEKKHNTCKRNRQRSMNSTLIQVLTKKWNNLIDKRQKRGDLFTAKGILDVKQEALTVQKISDGKSGSVFLNYY